MFNGLTKGLAHIGQCVRFAVVAAEQLNAAALADWRQVATLWVAETFAETQAATGTTGTGLPNFKQLKFSAWGLLGNADPWRGSRSAFRALQAKYPAIK